MSEMRQYILDFISSRELSLSKLAQSLGYKSKTSLVRLMDDNTREKSVRQFESAMTHAFALTDGELEALRRAVQITLLGRARYLAEREMWRFVQGEAAPAEERLTVTDAETGADVDLMARYAGAEGLRITLVNGHGTTIFPLLRRLLERGATVEHYIYADDNDAKTICAVNSLLAIFYQKGYSGYVCMGNRYDEATAPQGLMESDLMVVRCKRADGVQWEDVLVFPEPDACTLLTHQGDNAALTRMLGLKHELYTPIKRTYFQCSALENYIKYSQDYADLERNRAILKLKPDIGVDWIPVQILAAALMEGPLPPEEMGEATIQALYEIYGRRFHNTFAKHKPAHTIMKRSAMQRFAQTGRTSDHFWAMRPYTPQERVAILSELLNQQQNNPYFHIYFLADEQIIRNAEFALYENLGILMLESDTDYNLAGGHSEILLTHPELMRLFQKFFMDELIKHHVLPEAETVRFLQGLVEEAGKER